MDGRRDTQGYFKNDLKVECQRYEMIYQTQSYFLPSDVCS